MLRIMNKRTGYIRVVEIREIPIFVHWSLPLGGVLFSIFCHVNPKQWIYYCIAFTLLVITHECGHLFAANILRLKVFAIEISGLGGLCQIERPHQVLHSVFLYSAGLIAQVVSFLAALAYIKLFGDQQNVFCTAILMTFTFANAWLFIVNLIPQRASRSGFANDGLVLWQLFLHAFRGHKHPHPPLVFTPTNQTPIFPPETRLLKKPGFRPHGFIYGIEILNDGTTPAEFVIKSLITHLGLTQAEAIVKTLDIHNTGGMLIALPSANEAQRVADLISNEALIAGHNFVCRYASTR